MHETPSGTNPQQDQERGQSLHEQQNQQKRDQSVGTGGSDAGTGVSGMQDGEASGAGYGNNAGEQDGADRDR